MAEEELLRSAAAADGSGAVAAVDVAAVVAPPPHAKCWAYFVCLQREVGNTVVGAVLVGLYSLGT